MQHVDAFSRASLDLESSDINKGLVFNVSIHEDEILMRQSKDEILRRKIQI